MKICLCVFLNVVKRQNANKYNNKQTIRETNRDENITFAVRQKVIIRYFSFIQDELSLEKRKIVQQKSFKYHRNTFVIWRVVSRWTSII